MKEYRLTTVDNPYDPFTQFENWFLYDETNGYHTCGLLARISNANSDQPDEVYEERNKAAIDEIMKNDFTGLYKVVSKDN